MLGKKHKPMENKQKSALIAALCALAMIVTLMLSFVLSANLFPQDKSVIVLPSEMEPGQTKDDTLSGLAQQNAVKMAQIVVDANNVQAVIASLSRPNMYSCQITNTLYWSDGSGTLRCRQYVKDGAYRVEQLRADGNAERVQLQYQDIIYAWDAGSSDYYKGAAGGFTPGEAAMLPTYETICALPRENILAATLDQSGDEPIIRVTAIQDGRTADYVVSAVTGLLYRATFMQNGAPVQTVEVSSPNLDPPPDALFTLPGMTQTVFSMD